MKYAAVLALVSAAAAEACGPVQSYGYGRSFGYGYTPSYSYAAPAYQAQAYVPVALAVVSPYVPTVAATLQAVPVVPAATVAPAPAAAPAAPQAAPKAAPQKAEPPADAPAQRQSLSNFTAAALTDVPEFVHDEDDGEGVTRLVGDRGFAVQAQVFRQPVVRQRVVVRQPVYRAFVPRAVVAAPVYAQSFAAFQAAPVYAPAVQAAPVFAAPVYPSCAGCGVGASAFVAPRSLRGFSFGASFGY